METEWCCWIYCCKYRVFLCMKYRPDFHIYSLLLSSQSKQLHAWFDLVNVHHYVLCKHPVVWYFYCSYSHRVVKLCPWNTRRTRGFFNLGTECTVAVSCTDFIAFFCGQSRVWMVFSISLCSKCGWYSFGAITVKSGEFLLVLLSEEECWIGFCQWIWFRRFAGSARK